MALTTHLTIIIIIDITIIVYIRYSTKYGVSIKCLKWMRINAKTNSASDKK